MLEPAPPPAAAAVAAFTVGRLKRFRLLYLQLVTLPRLELVPPQQQEVRGALPQVGASPCHPHHVTTLERGVAPPSSTTAKTRTPPVVVAAAAAAILPLRGKPFPL